MVPPLRKWSAERKRKHPFLRLIDSLGWALLWLLIVGFLLQSEAVIRAIVHSGCGCDSCYGPGPLQTLGLRILVLVLYAAPFYFLLWVAATCFCSGRLSFGALVCAAGLIGRWVCLTCWDSPVFFWIGFLMLAVSVGILINWLFFFNPALYVPCYRRTTRFSSARGKEKGLPHDRLLSGIHWVWRILVWPTAFGLLYPVLDSFCPYWFRESFCDELGKVVLVCVMVIAPVVVVTWFVYVLFAYAQYSLKALITVVMLIGLGMTFAFSVDHEVAAFGRFFLGGLGCWIAIYVITGFDPLLGRQSPPQPLRVSVRCTAPGRHGLRK